MASSTSTVSPFAAALDDAWSALEEAIEALDQAVESHPKGPESPGAQRFAALSVGIGLFRDDVKRRLGQEVGGLER